MTLLQKCFGCYLVSWTQGIYIDGIIVGDYYSDGPRPGTPESGPPVYESMTRGKYTQVKHILKRSSKLYPCLVTSKWIEVLLWIITKIDVYQVEIIIQHVVKTETQNQHGSI